MRSIHLGTLVAVALVVGACSTMPVQGSIDDVGAPETFTGTARGHVLDHSGTLTILTNKGVTCAGRFVYLTEQEARGTFDCGNGQSGPFELVRTGTKWTGSGIVGNRRVRLEFGQ